MTRGDIKLYLTEGTLAFTSPTLGKRVAAVFTTAFSEAGDAEILILPPLRGERASLASFAKSPNVDEHFSSAVFFFSDSTAEEVLAQIHENPRPSPDDEAEKMAAAFGPILRADASNIDVRLAQSLLDSHRASRGFFYAMIAGRTLGTFDLAYEPDTLEPVIVGRVGPALDGHESFQIWTNYRPRHAPAPVPQVSRIHRVQIRSNVHPDLSMSFDARFQYTPDADDGRVIALKLAARLRVTSASVDDKAADVFQHESVRNTDLKGASAFLIVTGEPLAISQDHEVEVHYDGSVIRRTRDGSYFVDERSTWYPFIDPTLSKFDLTFEVPAYLNVVATGEPVNERIIDDTRTIQRETPVKESLAGFNLGEYNEAAGDRSGYHVEIYSEKNHAVAPNTNLLNATGDILHYYSRRWNDLPIHTLAVSPIEGYFGQGFPGLIYLSSVAYEREQDRPEALRTARSDSFFQICCCRTKLRISGGGTS